ncbi:MAG: peroxidase-related enzyme [Bacteroidota bacterium]
MPFLSYLHSKSDITDILFRNPRRFSSLNIFTHKLLRGKSELTIAERELIAAFVSATNACNYCAGIHTAVAERFGVDPSVIQALSEDIDTAPVSDKMKPILKLSQKLTLSPVKMQESDVEAIKNVGWSEQTVEDVVCITGLFNFYNRLLEGHGIKGFPEIFEEGSMYLKKHGYNIPGFVARFLLWRKNRKMKKTLAMSSVQ